MDFDRIFASRPVNITAYRVTGQAGCAKDDAPITESEIKEAIARLVRKQRLLKVVQSFGAVPGRVSGMGLTSSLTERHTHESASLGPAP